MQSTLSSYNTRRMFSVIFTLSVGILFLAVGCPVPTPPQGCTLDADCTAEQVCNTQTGQCEAAPPAGCATDADCDAGQICNTQTAECEDAPPAGCTSDGDCEAGEFCNTETGECTTNENLFATTAFDTDFDQVHGLHQAAANVTCADCHHQEPVSAGFSDCRSCHADDPNGTNSFKDAAHDTDESGDGCRQCHAAEFEDNCSFCHTELQDQ